MEKYYLKKWVPIFRTEKRLIIGVPKSISCVDIPFSNSNYVMLEKLIESGVHENKIKSIKLYQLLLEYELLDTKEYVEKKRNELFLEYININDNLEYILGKKILIFGAGAGGSTLCFLLAQLGFSNLFIVDDDIVTQSEIEKTVVFRKKNINEKKTIALKAILEENFNIPVNIISERPDNESQMSNIINGIEPDFIIKACDPNTSFRIFLNNICFRKKIPFIHMAYSFETNIIGPLFVPGITCCDLSLNEYQKSIYGEDHDFNKVIKLFTTYTTHPSINFNINILANLILKEIIFFLLGKFEFVNSLGKVIRFSPLSLRGSSSTLPCISNCKNRL